MKGCIFDFSRTRPARVRFPAHVPEVIEQPGRILINSGPSEAGWHRIELFMKCPQLWAYSYLCGIDTIGYRLALERGSLIHVGVGHYYARWEIEKRGTLFHEHEGVERGTKEEITDRDRFYSVEDAMALAARASEDPTTAGIVWDESIKVVRNYIKWAAPRDAFRVVGVEQPFRTHVAGHLFTARADLVIEMRRGIKVWDHKSASNFTKTTLAGYTLSGQIHCLRNFGREYFGNRFKGVSLNVLGTSEPYEKFERVSPVPSPEFTARMVRLISWVEFQIKTLIDSGINPWEWPVAASEQTCVGRYGQCPAYDTCHKPPRNKPLIDRR